MPAPDPRVVAAKRRHWRSNVGIVACLLAVWAAVGPGCGVWWAEDLAGVHLYGFPLGFWFAQQGSIVVFVLLILVYALLLGRLDRRLRRDLAALGAAR